MEEVSKSSVSYQQYNERVTPLDALIRIWSTLRKILLHEKVCIKDRRTGREGLMKNTSA